MTSTAPEPEPGRDPIPAHVSSAENALRMRFYIGGQLRNEVWLDAADPRVSQVTAFVSNLHTSMAALADDAGVLWLDEIYDPAAPLDEAYLRIGTDPVGMIQPAPLNEVALDDLPPWMRP